MKLVRRSGLVAGAVLLGAFAASGAFLSSGSQEGVQVGDLVTYQFRTAPVNARGVTSLDDLRGQPVLVDFWGTR